jgi:two-component system phosphate regulon sensor histidine kinase PhoR
MLVQGGLEPPEQQIALDVTARRVQALVNLVESITTLQDLDSHPLRIERVQPAELIQTACQMTAQRATGLNIELRNRCQADLTAFPGDFTRLAQAMHQLLDNACKFSPEGSTVTVDAWMAPAENTVHISVTDEGIGIPLEEYDRIFERFYQIDGSTTRRYGGTGLGLALVKEIIQAHGGRVSVESKLGEGSRFQITLPTERKVVEQAHPSRL